MYKFNKIHIILLIHILFHSCKENNNINIVGNAKETCLDCHDKMTGFTDAHLPQNIGCYSCHLGNPNVKEKNEAHKNMVLIPGNLSNASNTCSTTQCHISQLDRIQNSLMTTNSGLIGIDKIAFDEIQSSSIFFHIDSLNESAADAHLKNLCSRCHLGFEKHKYSPTTELSRGGGCIACHLNYSTSKIDIADNIHPSIDLNVDNGKCFGCHSRSSRISTNYEGWYETLESKDEAFNNPQYRILSDGRLFHKANEDIHHINRMQCIDCHPSQDVMGDGKRYFHSSEAVHIACEDCHTKKEFKTVGFDKFDTNNVLDYFLRKYDQKTDKFVSTNKGNIPLVNTYFDEKENAFLISKISREIHSINKIPLDCSANDKVHGNLSCNMCHTTWAPKCVGCHTSYDSKIKKWEELSDDFGYSLPTMGVEYFIADYEIKPAIPGMIMTLDKSKYSGTKNTPYKKFIRFFSPISAHTSGKSRSCMSCHNDPYALGYGSGKLKLGIKKWEFIFDYELSENDNLPMDAWIGFLSKVGNKRYSGHDNFKPLNLSMQKKVLNAGACLECHTKKDFIKNMVNGNYEKLTKSLSDKCIIPY